MANKALKNLKKARTSEEIDKEYSHHALNYGHKVRVMTQTKAEVDQHMAKMIELVEEQRKIPKITPESMPAPIATPPAQPEVTS